MAASPSSSSSSSAAASVILEMIDLLLETVMVQQILQGALWGLSVQGEEPKVLVVSNRPGAQGLKRAALAGIQTRVVDHKLYGSRAEFDATIDLVLKEFGVELVCLAGFMRILTGIFVKKWHGRLLNIHPSLLPSFKGVNAQQQALQARVLITGCTVHFVAEEVDAGAVVVQEAVPVLVGDTEESLSARIREAEHKAFPKALELVASGAVQLGPDGNIVWKQGR